MSAKTLLCLAPDGARAAAACAAILPDWSVRVATGLREAERLLRAAPCPLGLLFEPEPGQGGPAFEALSLFLRQHWQPEWLAVLSPAALAQARWRELAALHLADYHTSPPDPIR